MAVAGKKPRRVSDKPARSVARHALRFLLGILIAVACVPLVLVPVYRFVDPPVSTLMLRDMVRGQAYSRTWVDIDEMAPVLAHSVIVSEDARFCVHNGVDWGAIRVVVNDLRAGKTPRGASTIAMQTAKNLFLWPSRSYLRKAIEVPLAYYMDLVWPKRRLIEIYLNTVEWDDGVYGAEAASRHYFGRSAARLTRRQAALLATALPMPGIRNPGGPSRRHARVAGIVEKRARAAGPWVRCIGKRS
ncbi:MAG: monofunctional biosynthetic peptidoglycan transglycosylase [Rhodobiaceae bacterium]|nr:monofunctional biosynthetic peptidoglycan transglycosylase [Rhodobiaceae bacterium]MCC0016787.1 monofunctional biosynthetic peptidoglycan transglycosylase [Rhodobiaceae bacterium]MCC0042606.1 monofunctional biosynthetic peptidoglycan transglycosylase [Rhodobiaceae bacterium]